MESTLFSLLCISNPEGSIHTSTEFKKNDIESLHSDLDDNFVLLTKLTHFAYGREDCCDPYIIVFDFLSTYS